MNFSNNLILISSLSIVRICLCISSLCFSDIRYGFTLQTHCLSACEFHVCDNIDMHQWLSFQMEYYVQITDISSFSQYLNALTLKYFRRFFEITVLISSSSSSFYIDSQMSSDTISIGVTQGTCISTSPWYLWYSDRDDFSAVSDSYQ